MNYSEDYYKDDLTWKSKLFKNLRFIISFLVGSLVIYFIMTDDFFGQSMGFNLYKLWFYGMDFFIIVLFSVFTTGFFLSVYATMKLFVKGRKIVFDLPQVIIEDTKENIDSKFIMDGVPLRMTVIKDKEEIVISNNLAEFALYLGQDNLVRKVEDIFKDKLQLEKLFTEMNVIKSDDYNEEVNQDTIRKFNEFIIGEKDDRETIKPEIENEDIVLQDE